VILWFLLTLIGTNTASADMTCQMFFRADRSWNETLKQIERLNNSGVLTDIILVQSSPIMELVRANQLGDIVLLVNERKRLKQSMVFFDEINLAVALGHNNIAMFLANSSTYPYQKTPLRLDLLNTAIYFDNLEMLSFFTRKKGYFFPR
jgi:phospholipid N-methyltransferase